MKTKKIKNKLSLEKIKIAKLENLQTINGGKELYKTLKINCHDSKTIPIDPIYGGI